MHNRAKGKGGKGKTKKDEHAVKKSKSQPASSTGKSKQRVSTKCVPSGPNFQGDGEPVKKAKKRKFEGKENGDAAEEHRGGLTGHKENVKKKKTVSWKSEISECSSSQPQPKPHKPKRVCSAGAGYVCADKQGFLSLLASTQDTQNGPRKLEKFDSSEAKRAAKRARRKERKLVREEVKYLKRNAESLGTKLKGFEAIVGRNFENESMKNDLTLVKSSEKMDTKRPRLDERSAIPSKKRAKSISPEREVVAGYKYKDLSTEQKEAFLRLRDKRRKDKTTAPKLSLSNSGNFSSMIIEDDERTPLTLTDVQHFLIYSLHLHHSTGNIPSWVSLKSAAKLSKIICLVVDGVSLTDFVKNEAELPVMSAFKYQLDVITPYAYGGDFLTEFLHVPLTSTQRHKLIKKYGSVKAASLLGEAFTSLKKIYPASAFSTKKESKKSKKERKKSENENRHPRSAGDTFPRTELLLRSWDLLKERVPVPYGSGFWAKKYKDFVYTKDCYDEVTDDSPIWALDCEMCQTAVGSELTRISIVNEDFEVVYESLVKPYNEIVNYLTQYSGITRRDLANVCTRLEDVHHDLRQILPGDVILAGHSIGNDLQAMKMFHPYVIDTSTIFNLSGIRSMKTKLKTLMAELLYERIQEGGGKGHDSVEDAASCLKLIKAKLAQSIEWGDAVLSGKRSEEESVIAQQMLLRKDQEKQEPIIYPTAANAIIRSGPRNHQTVKRSLETPPELPVPEKKRKSSLNSLPGSSYGGNSNQDEPFDAEIYSKTIFTHMAGRAEKKMLMVGDDAFISAGREIVSSKLKTNTLESRVQFSIQENDEMVSYACENAPSNGISIIKLSPPQTSGTTLVDVDNWVKKAIQKLKGFHTLFTVLLTGKISSEDVPNDNHGLFMMTTLKPTVEPLTMVDILEACS